MMILAKPSISPYKARTLFELQTPVVFVEEMNVPMRPAIKSLSTKAFKDNPKVAYDSLILTNSENALNFLYQTIPHDSRVLKSRIFKNKAEFRRAIKPLFPKYFFEEFTWESLTRVNLKTIPFPVILKPSVGIASIGVIRVENASEWRAALEYLKNDLAKYQANYSGSVVEAHSFIVEQYITGKEYAVDAYFDQNCEPVILNIFEHLFLDAGDTSDRMYSTRKSIVKELYKPMMEFMRKLGEVFDLRRYPLHLEVRKTPKGDLIPIEINPLRFAGLGTTEIAEYAYGINVYESFFMQKKPDWEQIFKRKDDSIYSFMCADLESEHFKAKGLSINDRALFKEFKEILEYRILDENETSTFAVIFFRSESLKECQKFLKLDLSQFISTGS